MSSIEAVENISPDAALVPTDETEDKPFGKDGHSDVQFSLLIKTTRNLKKQEKYALISSQMESSISVMP